MRFLRRFMRSNSLDPALTLRLMSWIDDIRCLYCDGRLPLYRKITNGQFCSTAHRKAYWHEHERLAVERLHQTHDSLRAYRPPGAVEAILGPGADDEELAPVVPALVSVAIRKTPEALEALHMAELHREALYPEALHSRVPQQDVAVHRETSGLPQEIAGLQEDLAAPQEALTHPARAITANAAGPAAPSLAGWLHPAIFTMPKWLPDSLAVVDLTPFVSTSVPRMPAAVWALRDSTLAAAHAVPVARPVDLKSAGKAYAPRTSCVAPMYPRVDAQLPPVTVRLNAAPRIEELEALADKHVPSRQIPPIAGMVALPKLNLREIAGAPGAPISPTQVSPTPSVPRAQLPLDGARTQASPTGGGLPHGGLLFKELGQLPASRIPPSSSAVVQDALVATDLRPGLQGPQFPPSTLPVGLNLPRLSLASGRRYRVETQKTPPPHAEGYAAIAAAPPHIALPERGVKVMAAAAGAAGWGVPNVASSIVASVAPSVSPDDRANAVRANAVRAIEQTPVANLESQPQNQVSLKPDFEPNPTGLLPLACNAQPSQPASDVRPAPPALSLPQPLATQPMRPGSKLEPLDEKPASDAIAATQPPNQPQFPHVQAWNYAVDFCKRAPRDLKMLVFAIPLLLGLALHPSLPKVRVAAPAAANGIERHVERAFNDQWGNMRQTVFDRAAVALDEDFRSGLDDWTSRGDATAQWSFDATGFVRPGPLALYRPSMNLTDYQMQFLGVIDKQALSWVVRAADYDNFYVVKLMMLKSGPLPTIGVVRYAVVNGKADTRVDTVAPLDARADMLYRVKMDIRGDDFALSVQGQMVDSWTEPRLRRGGIGFFSARGEESRLRWVQVTHQYDMLGRLCAYLAPYNIAPASVDGWQP
jgi:hypothetical protein